MRVLASIIGFISDFELTAKHWGKLSDQVRQSSIKI